MLLLTAGIFAQTDTISYEDGLAEANRCYRAGDFQKALDIFKQLNSRDSSNSDVLTGMARCRIRLEQYAAARKELQQAVILNSRDASPFLELAFIAIVEGKLDSAVYYYQKMLDIDDTYAEAYAGIGKMNYWKDKPKTALKYYEKALKLDPENEDYIHYRDLIKNELGYIVTATGMFVTEKEETYDIAAVIQRYGVEKRINDNFSFSLNTLWDYSARNNIYESDVRRWFDNTWLKVNFLFKQQKISVFAGASGIENKMTSYGASWNTAFNIKKLQVRNYLTAAYDYFYYWNKVGHDYYQNTLHLIYGRFSVGATYRYAVVRNNIVGDLEEKTDNPNSRAMADIRYTILKNPKLVIGIHYAYMNYKYASPLYYSPINRHVIGASLSNYYHYKKFYTYEEFIYGYDLDKFSQTSASVEAGFDLGKFSFGVSGNYFHNPYYQNTTVQVSLKMII